MDTACAYIGGEMCKIGKNVPHCRILYNIPRKKNNKPTKKD